MLFGILFGYTILCVGFAYPHDPWNAFHHLKRSKDRQVRVPIPACERAAGSMGAMLDKVDMFLEFPQKLDEREVMRFITGSDVMDGEERARVICLLAEANNLEEVFAKLDELGIAYRLFRNTFNMFATWVSIERYYTAMFLSNFEGTIQQEFTQAKYDLLTDLEASGYTDLDPEGRAQLFEIIDGWLFPSQADALDNYIPPALSNEPIQVQCARITEDFYQTASLSAEIQSKYHPDYRQATIDLVKRWTGVDLTNRDEFQDIVCRKIEAGLEEGLEGVYKVLADSGVFQNVISAGYPILVERLTSMETLATLMISGLQVNELENEVLTEEGELQYQKKIRMMQDFLQFVGALRQAGLLGLHDED